MRNISFALTTPQLLAGTKDVTRRTGWANAEAGQLLCAVRKSQGLKKGETIERLAVIELVSVRIETLDLMLELPEYGREECRREGFPEMSPQEFVDFFCRSHKGCTPADFVTRLAFRRIE